MAKAKKKSAKEASETFYKIIKASVMPNKNNPKEFDITLKDGTKLHMQRESSRKEGDKFIVTDSSGVYGSFVVTPEGDPSKSDSITPSQRSALKEIREQLNSKK